LAKTSLPPFLISKLKVKGEIFREKGEAACVEFAPTKNKAIMTKIIDNL